MTRPNPVMIAAHPRRNALWTTGVLALGVLGLWLFPTVWYTRSEPHLGHFWLTEQTNLAGWSYCDIPVSKAAETVLVADRLVNGEYVNLQGAIIRTFLAKRYAEAQNEIGLFAHTPDRCWTESGWTLEPTEPEFKTVQVHGLDVLFERRVFVSGGQRELVYFAGMVGGQPLPYRLDHNLAVGIKQARHAAKDRTGTTLRAGDKLFWQRVWDSFMARRPLQGPKEFLRISTPVTESEVEKGDTRLEQFLAQWLAIAPYQSEIERWRGSRQP